MKRLKDWWWRRTRPKPREDFATFALHGDIIWGNSITWLLAKPTEEEEVGRVVGWTTPRPREGDLLLVAMESGRWGGWVFTELEYPTNVREYADVLGLPEPTRKDATEFVRRGVFA